MLVCLSVSGVRLNEESTLHFCPCRWLSSCHCCFLSGLSTIAVCLLRAVPSEEWPSAVPTLAFGQFVKGASMGLEPAYKRSTYPRRDQVTSTEVQCHSKCHFIAHGVTEWDLSACGAAADNMWSDTPALTILRRNLESVFVVTLQNICWCNCSYKYLSFNVFCLFVWFLFP